MRRTDPLILGAGPAGCAAAMVLAQSGAKPLLLDRDASPRDALCGGFLSWKTAQQLAYLGLDCEEIGGHRVDRLRLFANGRHSSASLPAPAFGLSRRALDTALRDRAATLGVECQTDTIRAIEGLTLEGHSTTYHVQSLFLATGKHDVRGLTRPRESSNPALGLRVRLPATAERTALIDGAIELHLFDGGYAGLILQEGGTANLCLALRKSFLADCGGSPLAVLEACRSASPELAERMGNDWREAAPDTIGNVPYGFIATGSTPGIFRLGDQAAVIPSLAGEGIGIALASGKMAAEHWLAGAAQAAPSYQAAFAQAAKRPVGTARMAWSLLETSPGRALAVLGNRYFPAGIAHLMDATRIAGAPSLAKAPVAAKTRAKSS